MGIIIVTNERDVVRDMEVEESGEVLAEEELIIMTYHIGGEEARWTEMSIVGGEVETNTQEVGGGVVAVELVGGDFSFSTPISSPSWSRSS